jgi:hypothetical protein
MNKQATIDLPFLCNGEINTPLGGRYSLSSPHHSSPTQLHCVKTNNTSKPQTTQTEQQYLPQYKFQKTGLLVQVPSSSNSDTVATLVHQIMTELGKAVSVDRVMVITKLVLNFMQQNGC